MTCLILPPNIGGSPASDRVCVDIDTAVIEARMVMVDSAMITFRFKECTDTADVQCTFGWD